MASRQPSAAGDVDSIKQVKPLLEARCYSCHGALKKKGGLRLDTASLAIKGGVSGQAVVAGDPARSELLNRVSAKGKERMPPEHEGEPLTGPQVEVLRKWVAAGVPHPADEKPEADPRDHWAFKPVARRPVPKSKPEILAKNPIDSFVSQRHKDRGLTPLPEASAGRGPLLYAARDEALSKVWNFRVMSEWSSSLWAVGRRSRQSSMAARKEAKSG